MSGTPGPDVELSAVLRRAQELGFLGGRPIPEVIDHARWYCVALRSVGGRVLDLGTGGGVPGLVIAGDRPDLEVVLLDRRTKRTDFLQSVVRRLRWTERVTVVPADAADHLRRAAHSYDAVVARGFGPGEMTLQFGLRAVRPNGLVVISEPPDDEPDRWPQPLLAHLGAVRGPRVGPLATFRPAGGERTPGAVPGEEVARET